MHIKHLTDEDIQAYLTGEAGQRKTIIEAHLQQCKFCQSELEAYKLVLSEFNAEPSQMFSIDFEDNIIDKIQIIETKKANLKSTVFHLLFAICGLSVIIYFAFFNKNIKLFFDMIPNSFSWIFKLFNSGSNILNQLNISLDIVIGIGVILLICGLSDKIILYFKGKKALFVQ